MFGITFAIFIVPSKEFFGLENTVVDDILVYFDFIVQEKLNEKPLVVFACFLITCIWEVVNSLTAFFIQDAPKN